MALRHSSTALLLLICHGSASAQTLRCHEEPSTLAHICYDEKTVRANGSLRSAQLYAGGPKKVADAKLTLITECNKGVSTIQNESGINIAGAENDIAEKMRPLTKSICAVKNPKKDTQIRMF